MLRRRNLAALGLARARWVRDGRTELWCAPLVVLLALGLIISAGIGSGALVSDGLFQDGVKAYRGGDYLNANRKFRESAERQPASGTFQNLGNAEWQLGQPGRAILAWEQALWLDPFNRAARNDLRFARKTVQAEAPELTWYEVISTWLPMNSWPWITGASLWFAVGMGLLPGIFRLRKAAWHQALAAVGLMLFLLSLPAHLGVLSRTRLGFVIQKDALLRLTPTQQGQVITRLGAGDPARWERSQGGYVLIRTSRSEGWVEAGQFGLPCPR
jgi:tetratricopeptide (TPR) repeat protein